MTDFKAGVAELKDKAAELEKRADGLRNKHLRDLFRAAVGRLTDALGHPDVDLLADEEKRKEVEHAHSGEAPFSGHERPASAFDNDQHANADDVPMPGPNQQPEPFPGVADHATEERQEPQDHLG